MRLLGSWRRNVVILFVTSFNIIKVYFLLDYVSSITMYQAQSDYVHDEFLMDYIDNEYDDDGEEENLVHQEHIGDVQQVLHGEKSVDEDIQQSSENNNASVYLSKLQWWRGQDSNKTRMAVHPHKGARFNNMDGMIVDPSPRRLEVFFNGDKIFESNRTVNSMELCPKDNEYGIEGEGGYKVLQKVRGGILESMQRYVHDDNNDYTSKSSNSTMKRNRRSRILCLVYTVHLPNDNHSNLRSQSHTWGRRCDGFIGASNYTDHSVGAIDLLHMGNEEYGNMWQKVRSMWAYAYNHYIDEFDFFYICGDDTYVAVENLRAYLDGPEVEKLENGYLDAISERHKEELRDWKNDAGERPLIFGSMYLYQYSPRFAGGSGYLINRAALNVYGSKISSVFPDSIDSREDLFLGGFFANEGIFLSDTRHQSNGGWRFSSIDAEGIFNFQGYGPQFERVYRRRYGFQFPKGMNILSNDAISFHLKEDKQNRLKKEGRVVSDLSYRYEVVLYDMCSNK